jgi:hypothetical protein
MIVFWILQAAAGVPVEHVTQLAIVSNYAECILRKVGPAAADKAARQVALASSTQACRALEEADYTAGKFRMNGKPFPQSWWQQMRRLFDFVDADTTRSVLSAPAGGSLKVKWQLPDGRLVDAGDVYMTGTIHVRIVAA